MQQGPDGDITHEQPRQQHAWKNTGNEQLGNRDISRHAIDNHDDGGRYEQTQRTGAGKRPDDLVLRVAPSGQLRDGHFAYGGAGGGRSEEHTSELQSLMRISYDVLCLNKKIK